MNKTHLLGALCAVVFSVITLPSQAALIGVLPSTPGGTDYQAYYDTQLDISWTADADINGFNNWANQVAWAGGLTIGAATDWRLPDMDKNNDGTIVNCSSDTQAACADNEYGHLYYYGAGTTLGSGITPGSPGPFSNVQSFGYWSGTEFAPNPASAWIFDFRGGDQSGGNKDKFSLYAWAVHSGDVSAIPVPAAVWLFGSGLIGLVGMARQKKAA